MGVWVRCRPEIIKCSTVFVTNLYTKWMPWNKTNVEDLEVMYW